MERYPEVMDWENQTIKNVSTNEVDEKIQCNPYPNPSKLFGRYCQTYFKVYMESQKIQTNQHTTEENRTKMEDSQDPILKLAIKQQ